MDEDHPAVLGTLESLGEACLDARRFSHALKYFNQLFDRSQTSKSPSKLKLAMILHKIAVIYEHQDDPKAQIAKLEMALSFLRSDTSDGMLEKRMEWDRKIQEELRSVREELQKIDGNWV
jgi:tetratricopeptide (TPR) repeat protein